MIGICLFLTKKKNIICFVFYLSFPPCFKLKYFKLVYLSSSVRGLKFVVYNCNKKLQGGLSVLFLFSSAENEERSESWGELSEGFGSAAWRCGSNQSQTFRF